MGPLKGVPLKEHAGHGGAHGGKKIFRLVSVCVKATELMFPLEGHEEGAKSAHQEPDDDNAG